MASPSISWKQQYVHHFKFIELIFAKYQFVFGIDV